VPAWAPGIWLNKAPMADDGPPTRVVPVSIAAYDVRPVGILTELPFTMRSSV